MLRRLALLALLPWVAACTHDFGSFSYRDDADASVTGTAEPGSDAAQPANASGDGGRTAPRSDAAVAAGGREPPETTDASAHDAGSDAMDAGSAADAAPTDSGSEPVSPETMTCRAALQANSASESCGSCGCERCAGEVASCLGGSDGGSDPLCAAVVACAIENDCRFWGCYCRSPQCARNAATGDGPCAAAMEAAAGGAKAVVMAKWASTDLADPLVRARNLIACTLGLDAQHPLGPVNGLCVESCP
jgi:hypothetical protein